MQEKQKHREINSLLGSITEEQFAQLGGLGRKIMDYGADKQASAGGNVVLSWLPVAMVNCTL